jgi:hypothetical protein
MTDPKATKKNTRVPASGNDRRVAALLAALRALRATLVRYALGSYLTR